MSNCDHEKCIRDKHCIKCCYCGSNLTLAHKKAVDEPVSVEAQEYADKLFPCEKPCDSYGICDGCYERTTFLAGYNFGYRAGRQ